METEEKKQPVLNWWKKVETLLWITLVGYGIMYAFSMLDLSFIKGEIVAYELVCEVKPQYNTCPGKTLFAGRARHYKPNKERQEVLSWTKGFPPDRLTDCAVVDRKNWQCSYGDKSATFGFQNGEYFHIRVDDKPHYKEFYVSRQDWVKQDCKDSIYNTLYCIPLHGLLRGN